MINLDLNATNPVRREVRVRALRDHLEPGMLEVVSEAEVNGHAAQRLANTSNLTFRGVDSDALLMLLDQEGVCASLGSACLADSDEPSHVVRAMKPESSASRQMVRFSIGAGNTAAEVEIAVKTVFREVRTLSGRD